MKKNASAEIDKKGATKNVKKRNWAFVLYPESAPADWFEQLQQRGVVGAVSPLHDKDVNEDEERTPKKPHYHVLLVYKGPTAYSVVKALTDDLGQPRPQAIEQLGGYYRYLTHQDNPDKYQYDAKDIRTLGGFQIGDYVELSRSDVTRIIKELTVYIRQEHITEYADLIFKLIDEGRDEDFSVAYTHTIYFKGLLSSARYSTEAHKESVKVAKGTVEHDSGQDYIVNPDTGELITEA